MIALYAIATDKTGQSKLYGVDLAGSVNALFAVGARFTGGLAYHPGTRLFYAIAQDTAGFSSLYSISLAGRVQLIFGLGYRFTGGLAYRPADQSFYAVSSDPSGLSKLYKISLSGTVSVLFSLGSYFVGGLAHDAHNDIFYAVSTHGTDLSILHSISLAGAVKRLFGVGTRVRGGISYQGAQKMFYEAYSDDKDFGYLKTVALSGAEHTLMGLGYGFDGANLCVSPFFGASIQITSPLSMERFVAGEGVVFQAQILDASGTYPVSDSSGLTWLSNWDGVLGTGVATKALSVHTHTITALGHDLETKLDVRVYPDLWQLYQAPPAAGEVQRILRDWNLQWVDSSTTDPTQQWATYPGYPFDTSSRSPSRTAVVAKLDVLRHQRFSKPLPFGDALTAYDHVRKYTSTLRVGLGVALNDAGGGVIECNRTFARWTNISGSGDPPGPIAIYSSPLYLLLHENRHNEPGDPRHVSCPTAWDGEAGIPNGMDEHFEPGSGYAYAALYLMWVYKYGLYDPPAVQAQAKSDAISLKGRFCVKPASANPDVQALIDELWMP